MNQAEWQQAADEAYREQIRNNTLSELEDIYAHLDRMVYPQRFEMVHQELEGRLRALDAKGEMPGDEAMGGAGFFRRLWAGLVDLFVLVLVLGLLFLAVEAAVGLVQGFGAEEAVAPQDRRGEIAQLMDVLSAGGVGALLFYLGGLALLKWKVLLGILAFKAVLTLTAWLRSGMTPGMREAGVRLESAGGGVPSARQALVRFLGQYVLFALTVGISSLWMIWDRRKQALHDKLSGTRVVRMRRSWEKPADIRIYD